MNSIIFECDGESSNYPVNEIKIKTDQDISGGLPNVSFYIDRYNLNCVWTEDPNVNMDEVNQMMNSIEIANNHSKDETPSNLSDIVSASFPSDTSAFDDSKLEDESEFDKMLFSASTPGCHDFRKSAKRRRKRKAFKNFDNATPILPSPRAIGGADRRVFTRRKLDMNIDLNESEMILRRE